ncbi:MAG TPA: hypothetical protein VNP93_10045 [Gaiellaceae bacterium]|nr:hypothetical protein [Gaiellaceae bacterium]
MRPPGPWRLIAKRTLAVWPLVAVSFGAILLAATLLAAAPMYAGAAAQAGLERKLADADAAEAGVDVTSRADVAGYDNASEQVVEQLRRTLPGGAPIHRVAESDSVGSSDGRRYVLAFFDGIERHATLRRGRWPDARARELEAVVSAQAAATTGLGIGSTVTLDGTRTVAPVSARIVGEYAVSDPAAAIWWNDELVLDGVRGQDVPTYGPLVVAEPALRATAERFRASWRTRPAAGAFDVDDLRSAEAAVDGLEDQLGAGVPRGVAPPVVSTGLGSLLEEARREVGVARTGVLVPLAQLALLAAYGLIFVAALIRRRRRREDDLLLTRGAKPRSLALASAVEALALAVLAALAAPWVARLAIELVAAVGPLASAHLDLEPEVGRLPYTLAILGALACLAALVLPSLRGESTDARTSRPGFFARTGLDIALLVAAGVALWQLRAEGAPVVAGDGELDVLLVAVPAIGILAGAVLAGRLLPPTLAFLARAAARRPSAVPALAARRLARTAEEHRPAAVLLVAALAIGTFAAAYATTWDETQRERAALIAAADVLVPDDRRSDAYPPLGRSSALAATAGVESVSPLAVESLQVGGEPVPLIAVDAARSTVTPVGRTADRQEELLQQLAARRPPAVGAPIPDDTEELALTARVTLEPLPADFEPPPTFSFFEGTREQSVDPAPSLAIVVSDADGVHYRLPAGPLRKNGATEVSVELAPEPRRPVRLAALELGYDVPAFVPRKLTIELASPVVDGEEWRAEILPLTSIVAAAGVTLEPGPGLTLHLDTGAAANDRTATTVVLQPGRPASRLLPAIAGTGLLDSLQARIGDVVEVGDGRRVELIGSLTNFAAATEGDSFLVTDLPTLFAQQFESEREVARPDFWALELGSAPVAATVSALGRPPLGVEQVTAREPLERSLANNPLAVATSGALWLGSLASALFAVAAFAVAGAARRRKHVADASLLGGLGLDRRGAGAMIVLEDAALAVLAAAIGVGIGVALAVLVLPAVAFTETGRAAVPSPSVAIPWATVAVLAAGALAAILIEATMRARGAGRASIAAELRAR